MREIRTYGLKRGPPHRQHLGGVLYSTRGKRLVLSAATFLRLFHPSHPGLPTLRPRSGQPCSPFETGVLLVRRPARRTPVRRRGRVLSKPPRLKGFRPAAARHTGFALGYPLATLGPHFVRRLPDRGRVWPPWSSSAARPSPFFGRVVPQPRVFALLPAPRARHIPRYVVGEAPPPRLAGVPHPRRRTVGLERASAGLRTLEAASPAAKARFSSLPLAARLCLALARRVTAAKRGTGFEHANPSDRVKEPTVAREQLCGPDVILTPYTGRRA